MQFVLKLVLHRALSLGCCNQEELIPLKSEAGEADL